MKKLFLMLITLIVLFGCDDIFPERCEIENTCLIKFVNNSDSYAEFAVTVEDQEDIFKTVYASSPGDTMYISGHVPAGNSTFIKGWTFDEETFLIEEIIDEFKTECCEEYIIEFK